MGIPEILLAVLLVHSCALWVALLLERRHSARHSSAVRRLLTANEHLAREHRIAAHRAHIYRLRLRERQAHDEGV